MKKIFIYIIASIVAFNSCEIVEDGLSTSSGPDSLFKEDVLNQVAVIGEKIPNPYSLEVMLTAYRNLFPSTKAESQIQATHHYIKFIPKSEKDLIELDNLDGIDLFLYPLDHVVSDGRIDVDPRYSYGGYQNRWCYVPIEYSLSNIKCEYEVLYDIYSPSDDPDTKSAGDISDMLEVEAHRLCGIELKEIVETKATRVTPSGCIRFWDNHFNTYKGCEGLSIQAVRGTHSSYGHCDANGYFSIDDTFKYEFSYQIHFSRTDFILRRNDSTSEVVYKYSGYHGSISKSYGEHDEATYFAKITRAAVLYYYGIIDGLRRPPMKNDSNSARLAIQANLSNDSNNLGTFNRNGRFILSDRPIINIYQKNSVGIEYDHKNVFATAIHELTHAAHWRVNHSGIYNTDKIVVESLARGIQWYLTNKEYASESYSPFYYRKSYTGIVEDLVDGYGTTWSSYYGVWNTDGVLEITDSDYSYYDRVTGLTIVEVEEAAIQSRTWDQWYSNVYLNATTPDKDYIYEAFNYWNNI